MSAPAYLTIASALFFALFLWLGHAVTRSASLWRIDAEAVALRGHATPLARFLTFSGRGPFLSVLLALMAVAFWRFAEPLRVLGVLALSQLLSQAVIEALKRHFIRKRPDYWLIGLERGFSHPSGHASTAVTFFISCAALALLSPWPRPEKLVVAELLVLWALGIVWSRLALGAHYPTDVAGGMLFGAAWTCAVAAISLHFTILQPWRLHA